MNPVTTASPTSSPSETPPITIVDTELVIEFNNETDFDMFVNEGWTIAPPGYNDATAAKAPSTLEQNEEAKLALTVQTADGGLLTFRLKSDLNSTALNEKIVVYDNDEVILDLFAPTLGYALINVPISAGLSTIKWVYNSGNGSGSGDVLVDHIIVTPEGEETSNPTTSPTLSDHPSPNPVTSEPTSSPSGNPTSSPVTADPTESPTSSSPTNLLPSLELAGNNGEPTDAFPLKECQGDCDDDTDCGVRIMPRLDFILYNIHM